MRADTEAVTDTNTNADPNMLVESRDQDLLLFSGLTEESICSRLLVSVDIKRYLLLISTSFLLERMFVMTWGRGRGEAVTSDGCL